MHSVIHSVTQCVDLVGCLVSPIWKHTVTYTRTVYLSPLGYSFHIESKNVSIQNTLPFLNPIFLTFLFFQKGLKYFYYKKFIKNKYSLSLEVF